jgi:outer membrane protein OmpA-like peptidoglycan-associated protein
VKNFLVSKGVEQSRIVAKGYGASDFADPAHPTAAGNRRVEARRID